MTVTSFKILRSDECPQRLFEFRYDVYVREMARPQRYADHEAKTIIDPLDLFGINVLALEGDKIVGCVRTNFLRHGSLGEYEEFYGLKDLCGADRDQTSICTRLMIGSSRRRSFTTFGVMRAVYEYGLNNGIRFNFIDCNEHLVGFFQKFGYRLLGAKHHVEYGEVSLLKLDLIDEPHLTAVKSPFLPSLQAYLAASSKDPKPMPQALVAAE